MNEFSSALSHVRWTPVDDVTELSSLGYLRVLACAERAIAQSGRFMIVLAGGNTPYGVYRQLASADTNWSCWHIYFGDERCLTRDDTGRNSHMAGNLWLDHVPIPAAQQHVISAELGAREAAMAYAQTLHDVPDFDLVLLGLGEDGHTASLFPDHDWGMASDSADVLPIFDAPKAPMERVSMSAHRLSRTNEALFLVAGESKRAAVQRWRIGANIPARSIQASTGVEVLVESRLLF